MIRIAFLEGLCVGDLLWRGKLAMGSQPPYLSPSVDRGWRASSNRRLGAAKILAKLYEALIFWFFCIKAKERRNVFEFPRTTVIATLSFSQKRNIKVNVYPKITAQQFILSLNSEAESLNNCSIQLLDSTKKSIKTVSFPKPAPWRGMKQYTEVNFPILDLAPGTYTYVIYLGSKEEVCKGTFTRDPFR